MHVTSYGVAGIKAFLLDTAGHTTAEGAHQVTGGALDGTSSGHLMPPEVALCVSLYAYPPGGFATQKGRKRGRIYLPYLTATINDIDGKVTAAARGTLATEWAAFFTACNGIQSAAGRTDPMNVVVASSVGAGATYEVLHVAVDDHWDMQKRRQRQDTPVRSVADVSGF
jgi:hypothetical protein